MSIEWNKIATNAISALVVTVFLGAATIVWKGATSVDSKVQATREDMTHLIDALSDKLGSYEVQIVSLSNQLATVIANQANMVTKPPLLGMGSPMTTLPVSSKPLPEIDAKNVQQKVYSQDIMRQLKR
jgi:hypothetical protein